MGITSGYGERPRRAFVISAATVWVFFVIYEFIWFLNTAFLGGERQLIYEVCGRSPVSSVFVGWCDSLFLSAESFTTLVLGGTEVGQGVIRILAYVEGFIGAFMIALFVFTLTRAVHR